MAWREVRRRHKLIFRFDPELELIEIVVRGKREMIQLNDYRPASQLRLKPACRVQTDNESISAEA
ncbi:MAG: hypothetical protein DCC55_29555 [Chloroflexi bacterium]|nr:MAG: hypothetical protein DCC55_29555 [Chloroflexota bacterium]